MIIKIWPIKADYGGEKGKVGGIEGIKNTIEYITDESKTISKGTASFKLGIDDIDELELDYTDIGKESFINHSKDIKNVLNYMTNDDKTKNKYVSGYLCDPQMALKEFVSNNNLLSEIQVKGNVAFHIVQSFPEDLDISDEEVHQCGIELCQRLGLYQAVICSHVHPVMNDKKEVKGKCKHNHILINAYPCAAQINLEIPGKIKGKYNDCTETYEQLQAWNDEIAIDHGLPIIRNPDLARKYSWRETALINEGLSWKERIRSDIEEARRATFGWEQFVDYMTAQGYQIKAQKHVTYVAPDGKHAARGDKLGQPYSREGLETYWKLREEMLRAVDIAVEDNASPPISKLVDTGVISVAIPLGKQGKQRDRRFYQLSLDRDSLSAEAAQSYFNPNDLYDLCNENGQIVASAIGRELIAYYERQESDEERNKRAAEQEDKFEQQNEEDRRRRANEEEKKNSDASKHRRFIDSRTHKPYRLPRHYDELGRPLSDMEAVFVMAMVVIRKEDQLWMPTTVPPKFQKDACYAKTDWKIQRMLDGMRIAQEEGVEKISDLDKVLHETGARYSRARSAFRKVTAAKEKMEPVWKAVTDYEKTHDVAEQIYAMPDNDAKEQAIRDNQEILDRHRAASRVLHTYKISDDTALYDFKYRWRKVEEDIRDVQERLEESKKSYYRLKKLKYSVSLAESKRFCYGPEYEEKTAEKAGKKKAAKEAVEGRNERK